MEQYINQNYARNDTSVVVGISVEAEFQVM